MTLAWILRCSLWASTILRWAHTHWWIYFPKWGSSFCLSACGYFTEAFWNSMWLSHLVVGSSIAFENPGTQICISPLNSYLGILSFIGGMIFHLFRINLTGLGAAIEDMRASYMSGLLVILKNPNDFGARYLKLPLRFVKSTSRALLFVLMGNFFMYLYIQKLKTTGFLLRQNFMWVPFAASFHHGIFSRPTLICITSRLNILESSSLVVAGPGLVMANRNWKII